MTIVEMKTGYAPEIAKLHIWGVSTAFISSVGIDFIAALYGSVAQRKRF